MEIVIAEAVRSAVGRGFKGTLSTKRPDELAADVIRGLLARVPQAKGKIDDVVLGCAMPEGEQGLNVAGPRSLFPPPRAVWRAAPRGPGARAGPPRRAPVLVARRPGPGGAGTDNHRFLREIGRATLRP